jgi:diguanylate cyclase (GGDEF)-like protein
MAKQWVVVLEVTLPSDSGHLDADGVRDAVAAMTPPDGAALVARDRYALQLPVVCDGPAEAVLLGVCRWRQGAAKAFLPTCELVRVEAVTQAEFDRECSTLSRLACLESWLGSADDEATALLEMAFCDPLTGFLTPNVFLETVERALCHGSAVGRVHALLVVDCGGGADGNGEEVLPALATGLREVVRDDDVVGRVAYADFGVLLRNTTTDAARSVADRIIERLRHTCQTGREAVSPTVGIAYGDPDQRADRLLRSANAALRAEKRKARKSLLVSSGE